MTDEEKIRAAWDIRPNWDWSNGPITIPVLDPDRFAAFYTLENAEPRNLTLDVVTFRREIGTIAGKKACRFIGTFRDTTLVVQEYEHD